MHIDSLVPTPIIRTDTLENFVNDQQKYYPHKSINSVMFEWNRRPMPEFTYVVEIAIEAESGAKAHRKLMQVLPNSSTPNGSREAAVTGWSVR
jgi:hypothetical protein